MAASDTPTPSADRLAAARAEAARFLRSQPRQRLVQWALAAVLSVLGVMSFVAWSNTRGFVLLYSDLELKESAKIADHLDKSQVRYRVEEGGHAILVPSENVAMVRMQLADKGITASTIPMEELTDKVSPGMSVAAQDTLRRHVLQRELALSIQTLTGVASARVHLAPPEDSVFLTERRPAKASVILDLRPGSAPEAFRADGIAFLVANAVEGLGSEDVSIVATSGRVLWPQASEGMAGGQVAVAELKRLHEAAITEKALAMLAPVVGQENVMVSATVDLDLDRWERAQETFDSAPVLRSEQVGGSAAAGRTVNYELGRTVEKREGTAARVKRISVAVFVAEPAGAPREAAELRRFEAILKDAIGYDEQRGDRITVAAATFQPVLSVEPPEELLGVAPGGLGALSGIGPVMLAIPSAAVLVLLVTAFMTGRRSGARTTLARIEKEAPTFDRRATASDALRQWIASDPDRVAQLLRARDGGR